MENIIFGGIYSDKYEQYYKKIYEDLSNIIIKDNIQYKKIPQKIFEKRKNRICVWCNKNPCTFVFHNGEKCKIEYQLELYKKYRNQNVLIFFTDCDIIINHNNFNKYISNFKYILDNSESVDIIFQKENLSPNSRWKSNINIGLTICKPNDKIINFYEKILDYMNNNTYPNTWDQQVINNFFFEKLTDLKYNLIPNGILFDHYKIGGNIR
jgi:hypothetical protein